MSSNTFIKSALSFKGKMGKMRKSYFVLSIPLFFLAFYQYNTKLVVADA